MTERTLYLAVGQTKIIIEVFEQQSEGPGLSMTERRIWQAQAVKETAGFSASKWAAEGFGRTQTAKAMIERMMAKGMRIREGADPDVGPVGGGPTSARSSKGDAERPDIPTP